MKGRGEPRGRTYQSIVETVGRTPVVRINRLAPPGVEMFVKIEAFNPLGSVKDRLALGVIEAAEASGELKPGQTVIKATSGNTQYPVDFDETYEDAFNKPRKGVGEVRFVPIPVLIRMKETANRPQDRIDVEHLKMISVDDA
jgi:hypothetical protein